MKKKKKKKKDNLIISFIKIWKISFHLSSFSEFELFNKLKDQ